MWTASFWREIVRLSRRISFATHRSSGAESQHRALTYTLSSSKNSQMSVCSVAGAPSAGSNWMKSDIGGTSR